MPQNIIEYLLDMEGYFSKQLKCAFLEPEEEARLTGQKQFVSDLIRMIDNGEVLL